MKREKPYTVFTMLKETSRGRHRIKVIGEKRRKEYSQMGYAVEKSVVVV